jgi:hypothetical protein
MPTEFHFELPASDADKQFHAQHYFSGYNGDQDFFSTVNEFQSVPNELPLIQEIPAGKRAKEYVAIGFAVSPQTARGVGTKENPYLVPVMLHHDANEIKITAYDDEKKSELFSRSATYNLPAQWFPEAKQSSKWKPIADKPGLYTRPDESLLREKWSFRGTGPATYIIFSTDYRVVFQLGIQVVLTDDTNEPLAFYANRKYALKTLALYIDKSLLTK